MLNLAVGEPQSAPPGIVAETLAAYADDWGRYPPIAGTPAFRAAVAGWRLGGVQADALVSRGDLAPLPVVVDYLETEAVAVERDGLVHVRYRQPDCRKCFDHLCSLESVVPRHPPTSVG